MREDFDNSYHYWQILLIADCGMTLQVTKYGKEALYLFFNVAYIILQCFQAKSSLRNYPWIQLAMKNWL